MALLAVGTGLWKDFSPLDGIRQVQAVAQPDLSRREVYENLAGDVRADVQVPVAPGRSAGQSEELSFAAVCGVGANRFDHRSSFEESAFQGL
jgi:hypothetical protein